MPINPGTVFTFTCRDLGEKGESIGSIPDSSLVVFTDLLLPGETGLIKIIKCRKNYLSARTLKINNTCTERTVPFCPYFGKCGGCQIQNLVYSSQLALKLKRTLEKLRRIGGIEINPELLQSPLSSHYRNKCQVPFGTDSHGPILGFYKTGTHEIVPVRDCPISRENIFPALHLVQKWAKENKVTVYNETGHTGYLRYLIVRSPEYSGHLCLGLVINGPVIPEVNTLLQILLKNLPDFSELDCIINREKGNAVITQNVIPVHRSKPCLEKFDNLFFTVHSSIFMQVNSGTAELLYKKIISAVRSISPRAVLDLYCGSGTISLLAAQHSGRVTGIDNMKYSIDAAIENQKLNKISNTDFICCHAEKFLSENSIADYDLLIADPPRCGLDPEILNCIVSCGPKNFIYISCEPASLARDLKILARQYSIKETFCYDMFPQTMHIETSIFCTRR